MSRKPLRKNKHSLTLRCRTFIAFDTRRTSSTRLPCALFSINSSTQSECPYSSRQICSSMPNDHRQAFVMAIHCCSEHSSGSVFRMGPVDVDVSLFKNLLELLVLTFNACVIVIRYGISLDRRRVRSSRRRSHDSHATATICPKLLAHRSVLLPCSGLATRAAVAHGMASTATLQYQVRASLLAAPSARLLLIARRSVPGPARPLTRGAAVAHGVASAATLQYQVGAIFFATPSALHLVLGGCSR
jgi:hypothetical protein